MNLREVWILIIHPSILLFALVCLGGMHDDNVSGDGGGFVIACRDR
jgi:hypothetical protein